MQTPRTNSTPAATGPGSDESTPGERAAHVRQDTATPLNGYKLPANYFEQPCANAGQQTTEQRSGDCGANSPAKPGT